MKSLCLTASLLAIALLASASGAQAGLFSEDSPFGPGSITYDSDTDLSWLDLTVTTGISFNDMQVLLGPGGSFEGFRYATPQELQALYWGSAGMEQYGSLDAARAQPYLDLMALMGMTLDETFTHSGGPTAGTVERRRATKGMQGANSNPGYVRMAGFHVITEDGVLSDVWGSDQYGEILMSYGPADVGHFLVQQNAVATDTRSWGKLKALYED